MNISWMDEYRKRGLPTNGDPPHNDGMNAMTREEMAAHLQAAEARMDARVSRIETIAEHLDRSTSEIKADMKALKWWMVGTGIAVVMGVAAFNATVLSNMVASFESGKNTAQSLAQTQQKVEEAAKQLSAIKDALDKSNKK